MAVARVHVVHTKTGMQLQIHGQSVFEVRGDGIHIANTNRRMSTMAGVPFFIVRGYPNNTVRLQVHSNTVLKYATISQGKLCTTSKPDVHRCDWVLVREPNCVAM